MQFGILYSYWSREWACDLEGYAKIIKRCQIWVSIS